MNILALDVATKTGYCTRNSWGTWDLKPKRDESSGMRLLRFRAKLKEIIELEEIDTIVFEMVAGFHKGAIIVAAELIGILKSFCEESDLPYRSFTATEIKRFATGKGNANKFKMIVAAQERFGYVGDDDNTADAICLYHLAKQELYEKD